MTRCGGASGTCACAVENGTGIAVTGDGSAGNPYVVALADAIATTLNILDTATVNLTKTGDGSPGNPYVISAEVIAGTVTPATNPTMDIVGPRVNAPLEYATGPREINLAISADEGNALSIGSDDGLYSGAEGGAVSPSRWQGATIATVSGPFSITADIDGGEEGVTIYRPASLPVPKVGDWVYVQQPPTGETAWVMVGNDAHNLMWELATVTATGPLTITLTSSGLTGLTNVAYMPGYTPTVSDSVVVLAYGGDGGHYLILGLAPTFP